MHDVVFTNQAQCRDCYRCIRVCPVKAIRLTDGQASVDPERCLACGTCIRECPQGAKAYRYDLGQARKLVEGGGVVIASVAPSYVAAFSDWERRCLPSALRRLGFAHVGETAVGAYPVAQESMAWCRAHPDQSHLLTACPAIVSFVEQYRPEAARLLVPVVSPMIAHARLLKAQFGETARIIFIGPCVAKKAEASRPEYAGLIDCVLTFAELRQWLTEAAVDWEACEASDFTEAPAGLARCFPLEGGLLRTAGVGSDWEDSRVLAVSGLPAFEDALDQLAAHPEPLVIEPLFCPHGCINGPAAACDTSIMARRRQVLSQAHDAAARPPRITAEALATHFTADPPPLVPVSDQQLREALALTGKTTAADELNCGACGYASCRDMAAALVRGLAEADMCIPHMRRLAERRTDRIIETSPNGIVILDDKRLILSVNPAFCRFFACAPGIAGKPISYLMDPDPFDKVAAGELARFEGVVRHERYNLVCHQIIYPLPEEGQVVGILVNITHDRRSQQELTRLRNRTVHQAQELLDHQLAMARQMAEFLGESTARGEALVERLVELAQDDPEPTQDAKNPAWKRTFTSM